MRQSRYLFFMCSYSSPGDFFGFRIWNYIDFWNLGTWCFRYRMLWSGQHLTLTPKLVPFSKFCILGNHHPPISGQINSLLHSNPLLMHMGEYLVSLFSSLRSVFPFFRGSYSHQRCSKAIVHMSWYLLVLWKMFMHTNYSYWVILKP